MAKNKKTKPISEFITIPYELTIYHSEEEKRVLSDFVNLHFLGVKKCKKFDPITRKIEVISPEKQTPEFREAHWRIRASHQIIVNITYDKNLNLISITR